MFMVNSLDELEQVLKQIRIAVSGFVKPPIEAWNETNFISRIVSILDTQYQDFAPIVASFCQTFANRVVQTLKFVERAFTLLQSPDSEVHQQCR